MGVFLMGVMDKIEDLVFQGGTLGSVEIVKNRIVLIKMRCVIDLLSDNECHLLSAGGIKYRIVGDNLQVKEYGDSYVKVVGKRITSFFIDGGGSGE